MIQDKSSKINIETDRDVELIDWKVERLLVSKTVDSGHESDQSFAPSEPGAPARMHRSRRLPRPAVRTSGDSPGGLPRSVVRTSGDSPAHTASGRSDDLRGKSGGRLQLLRESAARAGPASATEKHDADQGLVSRVHEWQKKFAKKQGAPGKQPQTQEAMRNIKNSKLIKKTYK